MINRLKGIFGPKCTAVTINNKSKGNIYIPSKPMRFCEAVYKSFRFSIRLNSVNIGCLGARRSTGFDMSDALLLKQITEHIQVSEDMIIPILGKIPSLSGIESIDLSAEEYSESNLQPDLFILYVKPFIITGLMHSLTKLNERFSVAPYSFLSVCGNVFANCLHHQVTSVSFGCPESRKYGGIGKNEVVVGIPFRAAEKLSAAWEK